MFRKKLGTDAEQAARRYLEARGLKFVSANYHCRFGEIDLVMQDAQTLVFVEVRLRSSARYGGAAASVDRRKQAKLIATAEHYLQHHAHDGAARFDVVAMHSADALDWIPNAFEAG